VIDIALTTWLVAIGVITLAPQAGRLRWGIAGLALPTGSGLYVLVALVMLATRLPFTVVGALTASTAVALIVATVSGGLRSAAAGLRSLPPLITLITAVAAGSAFHLVHLTRLTVDSAKYLLTANALQTTGSLAAASPWDLRMRQLVTPLLHTGGVADGAGFSATVTPLFALSGLAVTGWLAWRTFERRGTPTSVRWLLLGSIGLLIVSTNRFVFHAFYLNGHMFFAVFALVALGLSVLAIAEDEWTLLLPASLALAAVVPLRPEGLVTAAVLIVPALGCRSIPYAHRWRLLGPTLATAVLWNGVVWPQYAFDTDLGVFGPVYGNLVVAIGLAAGLGVLGATKLTGLGRWGPVGLSAVLALYVASSAITEPDILRESLAAIGGNIAVEGLWGITWWILPLLIAGAWVTAHSEQTRLLLAPLPVFALAIVAFAYLRGGAYRLGTGDSANRMLLHISLIAVLAVLSAAAEAADEVHATADTT
jgi:hypothetical protein